MRLERVRAELARAGMGNQSGSHSEQAILRSSDATQSEVEDNREGIEEEMQSQQESKENVVNNETSVAKDWRLRVGMEPIITGTVKDVHEDRIGKDFTMHRETQKRRYGSQLVEEEGKDWMDEDIEIIMQPRLTQGSESDGLSLPDEGFFSGQSGEEGLEKRQHQIQSRDAFYSIDEPTRAKVRIKEPIIVTALVRDESESSLQSKPKRKERKRRIIGEYQVLQFLGRGSQGTVLKCQHVGNGELVAIKTIVGGSIMMGSAPAPSRRYGVLRGRTGMSNVSKAVSREIALLKKVNHPNIVKLLDVIDNSTDRDIHLVFEYVAGGPLRQLSDNLLMKNSGVPLLEDEARCYFRQLANAIRYLHFHGIVHRDIKPSNLIIDRKNKILKLTDLGIAVQTKQTKAAKVLGNDDDLVGTTMVIGTPAFLPPEYYKIKRSEEEAQEALFNQTDDIDPESGNISQKLPESPRAVQYFPGRSADVWAAGVTLFAFIYGCLPHMQNPRRFSALRFSTFSSSSSDPNGGNGNGNGGFSQSSPSPSNINGSNGQTNNGGNLTPSSVTSPSPKMSRFTSGASSRSYKSRKEPLTVAEMEERIIKNPLRFPGTGLGTSARLRQLLSKMLDKDPRKRIRIEEVCHHDWVCKYEPIPDLSSEQMTPIQLTKQDQKTAISRTPGWIVSLQRTLRKIRSKAHVMSSGVRAGDNKSFKEELKNLDQTDEHNAALHDEEVFEEVTVPANQLDDVQEEDLVDSHNTFKAPRNSHSKNDSSMTIT